MTRGQSKSQVQKDTDHPTISYFVNEIQRLKASSLPRARSLSGLDVFHLARRVGPFLTIHFNTRFFVAMLKPWLLLKQLSDLKILGALAAKFKLSRFCPTLPTSTTDEVSNIISSNVLIEEERLRGYKAQRYYPAKPGEVLHDRYKTLVKLGWGDGSTVWLAQDIHRYATRMTLHTSNSPSLTCICHCRQNFQPNHYVALKIKVNNFSSIDSAMSEVRIERHIANSNPLHPGHEHVRTLVAHFEKEGPDGTHICMVYDPMRETLSSVLKRARNRTLSLRSIKQIVHLLLTALDYLHSECHVIHTGRFSSNFVNANNL